MDAIDYHTVLGFVLLGYFAFMTVSCFVLVIFAAFWRDVRGLERHIEK
jgi:hypothetical protein